MTAQSGLMYSSKTLFLSAPRVGAATTTATNTTGKSVFAVERNLRTRLEGYMTTLNLYGMLELIVPVVRGATYAHNIYLH